MEIVLFQPDIPQNTGNIVRTCAVTGTRLTLVRPLGFSLAARHVKRAGLDYWGGVEISCVDSLEERISDPSASFYFFSSHAKTPYTDVSYSSDSILIFGSETKGLPSYLRERWPERFLTIPMRHGSRCLNLANSASIVLYEAWRQNHFQFCADSTITAPSQ